MCLHGKWCEVAQVQQLAASEPLAAVPHAGGRRRSRALDFLNPKPIPPGAFDLATRKDQICLKTATPKNTLLPEDLHYKVLIVAVAPGPGIVKATYQSGELKSKRSSRVLFNIG